MRVKNFPDQAVLLSAAEVLGNPNPTRGNRRAHKTRPLVMILSVRLYLSGVSPPASAPGDVRAQQGDIRRVAKLRDTRSGLFLLCVSV